MRPLARARCTHAVTRGWDLLTLLLFKLALLAPLLDPLDLVDELGAPLHLRARLCATVATPT